MVDKSALQAAIAIAATLPVAAGLWDIAHAGDGWAGNHHRYLGSVAGDRARLVERGHQGMTARFRLLTALVVVGGLARVFCRATSQRRSSSRRWPWNSS